MFLVKDDDGPPPDRSSGKESHLAGPLFQIVVSPDGIACVQFFEGAHGSRAVSPNALRAYEAIAGDLGRLDRKIRKLTTAAAA